MAGSAVDGHLLSIGYEQWDVPLVYRWVVGGGVCGVVWVCGVIGGGRWAWWVGVGVWGALGSTPGPPAAP
jgi:hypothetical protein